MIFCVLNSEKTWHHSLYICPPCLYTVATEPWEIQKVIFQQYYSCILHIIYVISKENKLLPLYPPHLKNVTALPCGMQNFVIWEMSCRVCSETLPQLGLVLDTCALAAAKVGCTNFIFIEPGAKINGQCYRDMLLMQRLLRRSATLLETCLSSSKTMRQHIVTQSSFCTVRHRSSSVLTSTR